MTLTQGLMALAAAVLLVLIGQGLWTSWRARPRRASTSDRIESGRNSGGPIEPSLELSVASELTQTSTDTGPASATRAVSDRAVRNSTIRRRACIDPLIDAIAEMTPEAPLPGDVVLAALPASRRVGSKPLLVEGLNAETGLWELPQHTQRYSAFQAAVQLANRNGPLNEIEYSEFVQKVQVLADALSAAVDFVDMSEAVSRARELDEFAHAHDAQLALQLRALGPSWTVGYLQQCAARRGMKAGAIAGQWVLPGEEPESPPLVLLTFDAQAALAEDPDHAALRECTLSLDVPQSPESSEPFAQWQRLASALAQEMEGALVDDDGRPVSIQQFASIHLELQRIYHSLASRELPAGSVAAQRLFS